LISLERRLGGSEEIPRVQNIVAEVLKRGPMKGIDPGSRGELDVGAGSRLSGAKV
jgi:hypothetical protein